MENQVFGKIVLDRIQARIARAQQAGLQIDTVAHVQAGARMGLSTQWQINQYLDGQIMICGHLYTLVPADSDAAANIDVLVQLTNEIRTLVNQKP